MSIQSGDTIPAVKLMQATPEGPQEVDTGELFAGKTAVLFGVPGAFTPTCSAKHLPGFAEHAAQLRAKGVDLVACVAVNDAFVMAAWARDQEIGEDIVMLADGSAALTRAMGLEMDLGPRGMGIRSQRFALIAKDRVVSYIGIEAAGSFEASKAETVLAKL